MSSQGGELSMDCKPHHSYSKLLKSFAEQNQSDQRYKLEEFVSRLEEERVKIDAFKRELPLCMQLLTNAMEASRQQLHAFRSSNQEYTRPILEEFIPITKHSNSQLESTDEKASDKASWMTSAQLWSEGITKLPQSTITTSSSPNKESTDNICFSVSPTKLTLDNKHENGSGAFLPFSKERNSKRGALPELALIASSEKEITEEVKKSTEPETRGSYSNKKENNNSSKGSGDCGVVVDQGKGAAVASSETQTNTTTTSQNHRKARRSWSPDLHRRFVNALQMLGGSQVATPKQIRELMKVDSLTNDEVKSHLQKYRLHTRRPSPSMQTGAPAPQLVVLGGIWVPPEYATVAAAHTGATALYGTHAPPPHYCAATTAVPQEFYTAAVPLQSPLPPPPHHHLSESIEDGKSESSSWKGESGENEGERKGLAALRERGEESTGSEITLKF